MARQRDLLHDVIDQEPRRPRPPAWEETIRRLRALTAAIDVGDLESLRFSEGMKRYCNGIHNAYELWLRS